MEKGKEGGKGKRNGEEREKKKCMVENKPLPFHWKGRKKKEDIKTLIFH